MKSEILICSNERIFKKDTNFFCENLDIKSIPEGLSKNYEVSLIGREGKISGKHSINGVKILSSNNFFSYLKNIFYHNKSNPKLVNFIISVTPYTFLASILIFLMRKKSILYLRSDGYEEYKSIFGYPGVIIYHLMFSIISFTSSLISCRKHILKKKQGVIVEPSQLTPKWFNNLNDYNSSEINLLYVGRIKIEKGIFSLLNILKEIKNIDLNLTVISSKENFHKINKYEKLILLENQNEDDLIRSYDGCKVFILPSFTEGHPQVLDEALARNRPVIVFSEIKHVTRDRVGVYVCQRNPKALEEKIKYIQDNYNKIQNELRLNNKKLPSKENFLSQLQKIINEHMERWPSG